MPIYCLNGAKSTRKRSKNIIHELINANNYYMNGAGGGGAGGGGGGSTGNSSQSHHHSTKSGHHHHHHHGHQQKCSAPSSLIMAINRLKHSTKDMKETVLIPTRLSDLVSREQQQQANGSSTTTTTTAAAEIVLPLNGDYPLTISDLIGTDSDSATDCRSDSSSGCSSSSLSLVSCGINNNNNSSASNLNLSLPNGSCLSDLNHFMALSMNSHNLYEQYKLVDLIDKIVSCDTILTVSNGISAGNFYNHIIGVGGGGGGGGGGGAPGNLNANGHISNGGGGYSHSHHSHHSYNQNHKRQFSNGGNVTTTTTSTASTTINTTTTTDNHDDNNNSKLNNNNNNNNNTTTTTATTTGKSRTSQHEFDNQNGGGGGGGAKTSNHFQQQQQHNDHNGFRNGGGRQRQSRPLLVNSGSEYDPTADDCGDSRMVTTTNGITNGVNHCSNGGNLVNNCSLLMIKENFEYHLNGLKEILNLMSNSAEYITQKYLEDIHCEDRFDRQVNSKCDQTESIRHYYTGNHHSTVHSLSSHGSSHIH